MAGTRSNPQLSSSPRQSGAAISFCRHPPVAATQLRPACPDPHAPAPLDDPELVALEQDTAEAIGAAVGRSFEESAAPAAIRAYVHRLRELDCPPEAVVVHIKRLLARAEQPQLRTAAQRRVFYSLREDAILFCIEEYFGHRDDG